MERPADISYRKTFCPLCEGQAAPEDETLLARLAELVGELPEDLRAEENEYRARLETCSSCDKLIGITCALCGCFIPLRAAQKHRGCPRGSWTGHPEAAR